MKEKPCERETESFLIAAQNNNIRTNYVKSRIDKVQKNSKCRLCGDRDEMINRIISECRKLRKYNTRHNWVRKMIHREFCKKLECDHTNKWYMYNPESFLENEMPKLLWNFKIQTDNLILAKRPDLVIVKKKKKKKQRK